MPGLTQLMRAQVPPEKLLKSYGFNILSIPPKFLTVIVVVTTRESREKTVEEC